MGYHPTLFRVRRGTQHKHFTSYCRSKSIHFKAAFNIGDYLFFSITDTWNVLDELAYITETTYNTVSSLYKNCHQRAQNTEAVHRF